jgi:hypothetical protein
MTYLVWHDAPLAVAIDTCMVARGVYVLKDPFSIRRAGQALLVWDRFADYKRVYNALFTHAYWAAVKASEIDGIEAFLGRVLKPIDGVRFPDVPPIPVNLPYALQPDRSADKVSSGILA